MYLLYVYLIFYTIKISFCRISESYEVQLYFALLIKFMASNKAIYNVDHCWERMSHLELQIYKRKEID